MKQIAEMERIAMSLITFMTTRRLLLAALIVGVFLFVPITHEGFQATPAWLLSSQGLEVYDDLVHIRPTNTFRVVNGIGTSTAIPFESSEDMEIFLAGRVLGDPNGYEWGVFDRPVRNTLCANNGNAICVRFDSTEKMKAYLGERISQHVAALREY